MAASGLAAFSKAVPIDTPPSLNITVPVAVPAPGEAAATVAVKGHALAEHRRCQGTNVVVVADCVTVCKMAAEPLARKLLSPP